MAQERRKQLGRNPEGKTGVEQAADSIKIEMAKGTVSRR